MGGDLRIDARVAILQSLQLVLQTWWTDHIVQLVPQHFGTNPTPTTAEASEFDGNIIGHDQNIPGYVRM